MVPEARRSGSVEEHLPDGGSLRVQSGCHAMRWAAQALWKLELDLGALQDLVGRLWDFDFNDEDHFDGDDEG